MTKYYYWKCLKCGRRFLSFRSAGHEITCPCGAKTDVAQTVKKDYDEYILERLSFK